MDANDQIQELLKLRRAGTEDAKRRYAISSRERLTRTVETKINTTMIGALDLIEKHLGPLWGHGKPRHQLTEQELEMERIKDALRTEILNNGNKQKRSIREEIALYDIHWNRHQIRTEVNG